MKTGNRPLPFPLPDVAAVLRRSRANDRMEGRAEDIRLRGVKALWQAVVDGRLSLSAGAELAVSDLTDAEIRALLRGPRPVIRATVRAHRLSRETKTGTTFARARFFVAALSPAELIELRYVIDARLREDGTFAPPGADLVDWACGLVRRELIEPKA